MRWCYLASHEIPDGERMVLARGGSYVCVPCSQTERGKRECSSDQDYQARILGGKAGSDRAIRLRRTMRSYLRPRTR